MTGWSSVSSSLWTLQQLVKTRQNPRQRFREVLGYEPHPCGKRGFGVQPYGSRSRLETTHALREKAGGKAGQNVTRAGNSGNTGGTGTGPTKS